MAKKDRKNKSENVTDEVETVGAEGALAEASPESESEDNVTYGNDNDTAPVKGDVEGILDVLTEEDEKVIEENQKRIVKGSEDEQKFAEYLAKVGAEGGYDVKSVIHTMNEYVLEMGKSKQQRPDTGAKYQRVLFNTYKRVTKSETEFTKLMNLLIVYFRTYKDDALSDTRVFRFMENVVMNKDEMAAYQAFTNLLLISAGLTNMKQVKKHADIERSMSSSAWTIPERDRVIKFYS